MKYNKDTEMRGGTNYEQKIQQRKLYRREINLVFFYASRRCFRLSGRKQDSVQPTGGFFIMIKDARYFTHDSNARTDHKIIALLKKYKVEGYGRFWIIIETMRDSQGYRIKEKKYVYDALAEQMQCTTQEVKDFIKDCIEEFELFVQEDGFFYSPSLIARMERLNYLRAMKARGAYAMHEKYGHNITNDFNETQE
jgi:hypothetical protein